MIVDEKQVPAKLMDREKVRMGILVPKKMANRQSCYRMLVTLLEIITTFMS